MSLNKLLNELRNLHEAEMVGDYLRSSYPPPIQKIITDKKTQSLYHDMLISAARGEAQPGGLGGTLLSKGQWDVADRLAKTGMFKVIGPKSKRALQWTKKGLTLSRKHAPTDGSF